MIQRLSVGLSLLLATSAILLLSDLDRRTPAAQRATESGPARQRKWKLAIVELNNILDVEETEAGIRSGLRDSGLVERRDYDVSVWNAQGDMANLTGLVDAAINAGADLLITLSTPALQAAIQRVRETPVVFTYVANAILAGAGRTATDHLANVTGIEMVGAYAEMMAALRQCMPRAKRVGSLFVPAEVNSVFNKELLEVSLRKAGVEFIAIPASTSSEVPDAATALMAHDLDAVVQVPGNLTAAAFTSIARAASRAGVPVFAFQETQAREGAVVVLARDFDACGRMAAALAVRIIRGENPSRIPFRSVTQTRLLVNVTAARSTRLHIPAQLMRQAVEIIGG